MLEVGSSATEYEPYNGDTYNIDLPVENLLPNATTSSTIQGVEYTINSDKSINVVGTATSSNSDFYIVGDSSTYASLGLQGGTYNLSGCVSGSNTTYMLYMVKKSSDNTLSYHISTGAKGLSINISNGDTFRIFIRVIANTNVNVTIYPQLEKGSEANSYTPYGTTPVELYKIGNYQDYFYKGTGKNLLSIVPPTSSSMKKGITSTYDSATGEISFSGTTTESYPWLSNATLDKPIQIGTNLIFSTKETKSYQIIARLYDSNGGMDVVIISPNTTSNTITTTREVTRIGILTNTNNGVTINDKLYLQLENGSTMTTFEPYGSKDKWCTYEPINRIVLDGSSYDGRGDLATANTYRYYFKAPNALVVSNTRDVVPLYSNLGLSVDRESAYNGANGVSYFSQANKMQFVFDETKTLSINDLKDWLDNNYFEVYYILAVPTSKLIAYQPLIDQLNELEKAMSKDGQTNISQVSNDKSFILDVTAIKSLQNVLDRIELLES